MRAVLVRGTRGWEKTMAYRVIVTTTSGDEEIYDCPTPEAAGELMGSMYGDDEVASITSPDLSS
jgi:hypothetical protein